MRDLAGYETLARSLLFLVAGYMSFRLSGLLERLFALGYETLASAGRYLRACGYVTWGLRETPFAGPPVT